MRPAFVQSIALPMNDDAFTGAKICSFDGMRKLNGTKPVVEQSIIADGVSMRCRRDLKKEKRARNMEFARSHRKRVVKTFNRRAAQEAVNNEDNKFLSSIYGTIHFQGDKEDEKSNNSSNGNK